MALALWLPALIAAAALTALPGLFAVRVPILRGLGRFSPWAVSLVLLGLWGMAGHGLGLPPAVRNAGAVLLHAGGLAAWVALGGRPRLRALAPYAIPALWLIWAGHLLAVREVVRGGGWQLDWFVHHLIAERIGAGEGLEVGLLAKPVLFNAWAGEWLRIASLPFAGYQALALTVAAAALWTALDWLAPRGSAGRRWAIVLLFFSPAVLAQAHYPWTRMAAVLLTAAALRARAAGSGWPAGAAAGGALLTHQIAWLVLIPLAVIDAVRRRAPGFSRGAAVTAAVLACAGGVWLFSQAGPGQLSSADAAFWHTSDGWPVDWLRMRVACVANSLVAAEAASDPNAAIPFRLSEIGMNGLTPWAGVLSGAAACAVVLRGRGRTAALTAGVASVISLTILLLPAGDWYGGAFHLPVWVTVAQIAVGSLLAAGCVAAWHEGPFDRALGWAALAALVLSFVIHPPRHNGLAHATPLIPVLLASLMLAARGGSRLWMAFLIAEWAVLCVGVWAGEAGIAFNHIEPNWRMKQWGLPGSPLAEPLTFAHDLGAVSLWWWLPLTLTGAAAIAAFLLRRRTPPDLRPSSHGTQWR